MSKASFRVRQADWAQDKAGLRQVRTLVFVEEQGVPIELEWDEFDDVSVHAVAEDDAGNPIGTGRLLPDGHIGRMAVLAQWRQSGVGSALLAWLMAEGWRRGHPELRLNAQVSASKFYEKHGFIAHGDLFMEAGIPHVEMLIRAAPTCAPGPH